jgi:hypothetical protein
VSVFVADLMIPLAEDYIELTKCVTVIGDMGRILTVVVLTWFKVPSQQLCGGTTEKHENSQIVRGYLRWDLIFPFDHNTKFVLSKCYFHQQ